ncbi:MAG: helix-turn-helix transcriptional regulator [Eubacterium sp.]|jgi:transcriptional regulator with XRE-family HTH domain|nr:helix-turn-helix transcriptional regulator [Eubacterium sp.]
MQELDYGKMGMRIRQLRKAKGWSQGGLAQKCGISMSFLGHIERGSRIMSMETFANICMALDAGADELLWGVAGPSDAVLDMWNQRDGKKDKARRKDAGCDKQTDKTEAEGGKNTDSYAMYVKIMKSVAEIMNEA